MPMQYINNELHNVSDEVNERIKLMEGDLYQKCIHAFEYYSNTMRLFKKKPSDAADFKLWWEYKTGLNTHFDWLLLKMAQYANILTAAITLLFAACFVAALVVSLCLPPLSLPLLIVFLAIEAVTLAAAAAGIYLIDSPYINDIEKNAQEVLCPGCQPS